MRSRSGTSSSTANTATGMAQTPQSGSCSIKPLSNWRTDDDEPRPKEVPRAPIRSGRCVIPP